MDDLYHYALKALGRRDYTEKQLREKLAAKFDEVPEELVTQLRVKRFVNDRRYAENFTTKHPENHRDWIRRNLEEAGVTPDLVEEVLRERVWPSLREITNARMKALRLRPPLTLKDAARLFRALGRLGYPEDEIQEELERLHE